MHTVCSLSIVLLSTIVLSSEALAVPGRKVDHLQLLQKASIDSEKLQVQDDQRCQTAQQTLYENAQDNECMQIFYNSGTNPFFNPEETQAEANTFCCQNHCGVEVPPLMEDITKYCGIDLTDSAELMNISCHGNSSRDYCLYRFSHLAPLFSGQNDTLSNGFSRCLNRNVTENPCPDTCKDALTDIQTNLGCCYGELLSLKNSQIQKVLVQADVFADCGFHDYDASKVCPPINSRECS